MISKIIKTIYPTLTIMAGTRNKDKEVKMLLKGVILRTWKDTRGEMSKDLTM